MSFYPMALNLSQKEIGKDKYLVRFCYNKG